jgi:hypothetical protein
MELGADIKSSENFIFGTGAYAQQRSWARP